MSVSSGSIAPVGLSSRIAVIHNSTKALALASPSPRPRPDRQSASPTPEKSATPQRFPESHAGHGSARFGSIRNGPETPAATPHRPGLGHRVSPPNLTRYIAATGKPLRHIDVAAWRIEMALAPTPPFESI